MPQSLSPHPVVSPFASPLFKRVWLASILSNFGGLIQSVGAAWLMTALTSSSQMVALVQASTALPLMLLSLLAGAMADNLERRTVMLAAQFFMLATSLLLTWCAWAGWLTPWILLCFTFAIGCGTAIHAPAWQASVADMVPRAALPRAVAYNSMGFNIARSVGPALGGFIVAAAGAAFAFMVNAVSYVALILVLLRWRPEPRPGGPGREPLARAMAAGIRYAAMSPNMRIVLLRAGLFGGMGSIMLALMPLIARDLVVGGPATFGLLLGAFGVGAVAGALSTGRLRVRLSTEGVVRTGAALMAIGGIGVALGGHMAVCVIAVAAAGAGWVMSLSTFNVTVQLSTPRWVAARALSLYQMSAFGGMAAGSWLFGLLAEHEGVATALLAAAAGQVATLLLGVVLPIMDGGDDNLDPAGAWREPEVAVPVEPRSGPIVISIEYRVDPRDAAAFVEVMGERRRIRLRDGARGWTLMRDLGDPALWIERYHVATWADYVRHNLRRTLADTDNGDRLRMLHRGDWPPPVHRMIERPAGAHHATDAADSRTLADPMTDPSRSS